MDIRTQNLQKKIQTIKSHIYKKIATIDNIRYRCGEIKGAEQPDFDDSDWQPFAVGQSWGGRDVICWFRMLLVIPEEVGEDKLAVIIQPGRRFYFRGSEGGDLREYELLVYLDGEPLQSVDVRRNEIPLWDKVAPGEKHLLAIEAFSGLEEHQHRFEQADLVSIRPEVEDFYYNCKNAFDAILITGSDDAYVPRITRVLEEALLVVDFLTEGADEFFESIAKANDFLKSTLYVNPVKDAERPSVVGLGHAHLDVAWMWQVKHSKRKAARTFANALRLMELYPEYHFLQSQPQLYKYIQELYPSLFERVKEKIQSGQWEATGGMWVEADCNIPAGESLVRQFLFGQRYFKKKFGVDPKVVWLPDGFGFNYALPQIIVKAGMRYFMTTKLSWSQFTKIPYDTFWWEGVDGTRVLVHMITTPDPRGWNDYSVDLNPNHLVKCWTNYKQKKDNQEILMSFGWGDGGGGPTRSMQENARRFQYLRPLPRFRQGRAEEFFADLEQRTDGLPVWNDELYLQFHRGCYTSQAQIKRSNRRSEVLFHNAELLSAIHFLQGGHYPGDEFNRAWELILLNQFHDILPGSSIPEVYQDSEKDYDEIFAVGRKHLDEAIQGMGEHATVEGDEETLFVFNPLAWQRDDVLRLPVPERADAFTILNDGVPVPHQLSNDGKNLLLHLSNLPSMGFKAFTVTSKAKAPSFPTSIRVSTRLLENRFFRIVLDEHGLITSLYDKRAGREVIGEGEAGNLLQIFEDRPLRNNAWDIDIFYQDKYLNLTDIEEIRVIEQGPIRGGVFLKRRFRDSTIEQRIFIYDQIPRIDFETEIDWHQHQTLLKVAFPVQVHANKATYEIQFGSIGRPTHWNTAWDWGRFEVPAQKWADLSEGDYGVSLLNDCKYGYDIKGNVMRLTLIKSAIDPDPNADIGHHYFCYSLFPHQGDWRAGGTVRAAYELNYRLIPSFVKGRMANETPDYSFVQADRENVVIETVKKEEDGDGIVIRLYEAYNQRGMVELTLTHELVKAFEANLLEEERKELACEGNKLRFYIKPYEIKTFIVYPRT